MTIKTTRSQTLTNVREPLCSASLMGKQSFCGHSKIKKPVAPFVIWWLLMLGGVAIWYVSS